MFDIIISTETNFSNLPHRGPNPLHHVQFMYGLLLREGGSVRGLWLEVESIRLRPIGFNSPSMFQSCYPISWYKDTEYFFTFDSLHITNFGNSFLPLSVTLMICCGLSISISSVVEFQRWWVLKSKLFAQKSTCSKEILIPTTLNHL